MKKLFLSLTLIVLIILGLVYGILFTKSGNNMVSSYIENKVNTGQEKVKLKVDDFTLTLNHLNFDAWINDDSKINISGDLSLFQRSVDLKYDIKINDLSTLKNLTNQEFKGPLVTNGIFTGNEIEAIIQGSSDIAQSQTKYYFNLENFEPKNINVQIKNAKIEDILVLLNKPVYAKGDLNIIADIKNASLSKLDGMVISKITNAKISNEIVNKELNQTLQSPITFQSDINAILTPNKIEVKSNITSSIAEILMNRTIIDLETNNIKTDYKIDVKNLSKLEGIISKKLNGQFLTYGSLKAFDETIQIEGDSNVFEGISKYNLEFVKNIPSFIKFSVENAKLEKILQVMNEPIYSNGDVNIFGDIKNTNLDKLEGTINSRIINASIINEVASTLFKQNLQEKINYDLNIDTILAPNQAISSTNIESTIGNLTLKKSIYDFKENIFMSDYLLSIPSLDKLKDILQLNLKGKMDINGEIFNKNNSLSINGNSDTLGGAFDFNFKNEKLNANLKNINVQELSTMLDYSKFFDAKADFTLDYDFLLKKGDLVFARTGATVGKSYLIKSDIPDAVYASYLIKVRAISDNTIKYLSLFFKSPHYWSQITEFSAGIGQPNVNGSKLKDLIIPFAPLAEQHQIAQRLDELLAQVDTIKARLDAIPAILKRFRQSVLSAAVSGKLTEEWRSNNNYTDPWLELKVKNIVTKVEAGKSLKCIETPPQNDEYGIIKISAVTWGIFDENESKTLPNRNLFIEDRRVNAGDFLISRANTIELLGNPVIVEKVTKNLMLSDKVLRLVMDDKNKRWLSLFLRSSVGRYEIESRSTGNQLSMRNIGQSSLLDIDLPKPSDKEQEEIVRRVDQFFAFADQIEQRVNDAKARVDKLTQSILAKAFRGELTADWRAEHPELISGENSADALLAKIQAAKAALDGKKKKGKAA